MAPQPVLIDDRFRIHGGARLVGEVHVGGAKPSRRCGLLGKISLLSLAYLLSFERRPFHAVPPDH